jgi:hypothetical protein
MSMQNPEGEAISMDLEELQIVLLLLGYDKWVE